MRKINDTLTIIYNKLRNNLELDSKERLLRYLTDNSTANTPLNETDQIKVYRGNSLNDGEYVSKSISQVPLCDIQNTDTVKYQTVQNF